MSSSDQEAISLILTRIYADIHSVTKKPKTDIPDFRIPRAEKLLKRISSYSRSKASGTQANVGSSSDAEPSKLASPTTPIKPPSELFRFTEFVARCGWMVLAICAHSDGFIYASRHKDEDVWINTCNGIFQNAWSIELFAKVRGLDWLSILPEDEGEDEFCPRKNTKEQINVPVDDPFHWYVSTDGVAKQPSFNGVPQKAITQNIYHSGGLNENALMKILAQGNCLLCRSVEHCNCNTYTPSSFFHPPLLELAPCGGRGLGIRALQKIPKNTLLGEYVGELYPTTMPDEELAQLDYTYSLAMTPPHAVSPALAIIDAARYGNWTRFINHSCRPSTLFFTDTIAGRLGMFVRSMRDINMFEELTIDYGQDYFTRSKDCACGEDCCLYNKESKEQGLYDSNDYNTDDDGADVVFEDSREYPEGEDTGDDTGDIDSGPACQVIDTDGMKGLHLD